MNPDGQFECSHCGHCQASTRVGYDELGYAVCPACGTPQNPHVRPRRASHGPTP